jgi:Siphovirus Gp157.
MTIYEIDEALLSLVDGETGELLDFEEFERLSMERDKKIEGMGCWVKELRAEKKAIEDEIQNLKKRAERADKKAESLLKYLGQILNGSTFKSTKVAMSYRTSKGTVVTDEDALRNTHPELMRHTESWKPDLTAIKDYINENGEVPFAHIEERTKLEIK